MQATPEDILTVGHSTRAPGELEELLRRHGVEVVLDVRAHPGWRRMPHFAAERLERSLADNGIAYVHLPELGGRRRAQAGSPNSGWRNAGFRGYADHMTSDEFERGLARVLRAAGERRSCLMCAEAAWWRCHRRLVADALTVRGRRVLHVLGPGQPAVHELTGFADVNGDRLTYPPDQAALPGAR